VPDGVLRRDADAAVQLDGLLADVPAGAADLQPGTVRGRDDVAAGRKVSAWNLLRVTPNCLRVFRYSAVARSAVSMAPIASCP
jgi:hypothetical protein